MTPPKTTLPQPSSAKGSINGPSTVTLGRNRVIGTGVASRSFSSRRLASDASKIGYPSEKALPDWTERTPDHAPPRLGRQTAPPAEEGPRRLDERGGQRGGGQGRSRAAAARARSAEPTARRPTRRRGCIGAPCAKGRRPAVLARRSRVARSWMDAAPGGGGDGGRSAPRPATSRAGRRTWSSRGTG